MLCAMKTGLFLMNISKVKIIHFWKLTFFTDTKLLRLLPSLPGSSIMGHVGSDSLNQCSGITLCIVHVLFIVTPVSVIIHRNSDTSQSSVLLGANEACTAWCSYTHSNSQADAHTLNKYAHPTHRRGYYCHKYSALMHTLHAAFSSHFHQGYLAKFNRDIIFPSGLDISGPYY